MIGFFSSPSDRRWSRRPLSDLRGMTRDRELSVVVVMHRAPSLSLGLARSRFVVTTAAAAAGVVGTTKSKE